MTEPSIDNPEYSERLVEARLEAARLDAARLALAQAAAAALRVDPHRSGTKRLAKALGEATVPAVEVTIVDQKKSQSA
ncbi:MAG: hypothetical protein ACREJO_12250 [Phycisphaerales bacterium]